MREASNYRFDSALIEVCLDFYKNRRDDLRHNLLLFRRTAFHGFSHFLKVFLNCLKQDVLQSTVILRRFFLLIYGVLYNYVESSLTEQ